MTELRQTAPALHALEPSLAPIPGTVSVWCGRPGSPPAYSRDPHATHYAASTMKAAVMAAAYRLAELGQLDLDAEVPVHDEFASAIGGGATYHSTADYDSDPEPWDRLGQKAPLRWLIRRMIVRSSNLATNLVLEQTGLAPVAEVWALAGAQRSIVARGIQDYVADEAGRSNLVTAADLAALLTAIQVGAAGASSPDGRPALASASACQEMLDVLLAQEMDQDVVQGLPAGTPVAHKNGWVEGVRHSAALILSGDAPAYVLVTCVSAPLDEAAGCAVVARVAAASWADRHTFDS
ncbi:serine hydrolase [Actinopolymorpha alba]|uniref:serine hydrolase n=1 Tax=Actinopolymorpha alba TaxID=533267 RepID=UPI00035EB7FB|nr:serine hydrolase [Actinopolymorpha alba]